MGILNTLLGIDDPPMETVKSYRDKATGDLYRFRFVRRGDSVELYCDDCPPDPHRADPSVTHLFKGGKICVASGVKVKTLSMAKAIAVHWMTCYSSFIRSGRPVWPRNGKVRVNVPD